MCTNSKRSGGTVSTNTVGSVNISCCVISPGDGDDCAAGDGGAAVDGAVAASAAVIRSSVKPPRNGERIGVLLGVWVGGLSA